jgi:branched-chain amino acid transport system substrate-binding protein
LRPAVLAVGLIAGLAASCSPASPPNHPQGPAIVIASDLPMTGVDALDVLPLRAAIQLAIDDHGPVGGYPLVYEPFDDSLVGIWDRFKGEQNARIMVNQAPVLGVVGPYNSAVATFEIPVTNAAQLVMISPSNTAPCLTFVTDSCATRSSTVNNYFRIAASDSAQASAAAMFAIRKLGLARFAVLTDGTSYGTLLTDSFAAKVRANDGAVVFRATFSQNATSYVSLLGEARRSGAEAVFVGGYVSDGVCRVRASMASVFPTDAYMLTGDNITDPTCAPDAGAGANDHLLAIVSSSQPLPTNKIFKEFQTHGIRPTTYAFGAYDCAQIIIDAIGRAIRSNGGKLPTRLEVLNAVAATHGFVGTTGTFTFQANGDAVAPASSVYSLKNGQWTFWQNAS